MLKMGTLVWKRGKRCAFLNFLQGVRVVAAPRLFWNLGSQACMEAVSALILIFTVICGMLRCCMKVLSWGSLCLSR